MLAHSTVTFFYFCIFSKRKKETLHSKVGPPHPAATHGRTCAYGSPMWQAGTARARARRQQINGCWLWLHLYASTTPPPPAPKLLPRAQEGRCEAHARAPCRRRAPKIQRRRLGNSLGARVGPFASSCYKSKRFGGHLTTVTCSWPCTWRYRPAAHSPPTSSSQPPCRIVSRAAVLPATWALSPRPLSRRQRSARWRSWTSSTACRRTKALASRQLYLVRSRRRRRLCRPSASSRTLLQATVVILGELRICPDSRSTPPGHQQRRGHVLTWCLSLSFSETTCTFHGNRFMTLGGRVFPQECSGCGG
jgi:hypothetical protein